jgi:carboxypeptidase family protein
MRTNSRLRQIILSFATISILSMSGTGQTITGTISGVVADLNDRVVPNATVTLISNKTNQQRTAITNQDGRFNFVALQPGAYSLKIESPGFQILERRDNVLSANETLALGTLKLQPGQVTETVTVTSQGAVVEKESSDLTARLTADQINLISTKGRDITSLLRLLP